MDIVDRRAQKPATQPRFYSVNRPEELTHLVCCRDHSWSTGLCGITPLEYINLDMQFLCTMCVEVARAGLEALPEPRAEGACPVDGRPCPDDAELDEIIRRHLEA